MKLQDIGELFGANSGLNLTAANGTAIPYKGWVEAKFRLNRKDEKEVTVPFLVTPERLAQPIFGYNVIELFLQGDEGYPDSPSVARCIATSFYDVGIQDAEQLVNLVRKDDGELFCTVKTSKRHITIPKKTTKTIPCRANTGTVENTRPVLFEPDEKAEWPPGLIVHETLTSVKRGKSTIMEIQVTNDTMHDLVLPGRTVLGSLELVRSVTPMDVKLKENEENKKTGTRFGADEHSNSQSKNSYHSSLNSERGRNKPEEMPEVDLSALTLEQQSLVKEMLHEERGAFVVDDEDVGCIADLKMEINLTDNQFKRTIRSFHAHFTQK